MTELVPLLLDLAQRAKAHDLNFTVDAEEADRLEARMQGGGLHGGTGPVGLGLVACRVADGFDRARIGVEIALGVGRRARAFAEHVEGVGWLLARARLPPLQRLLD